MANKEGKLNNELLRAMLKQLPKFRDDVVIRSAIGEDCAAILANDEVLVLTTDPITATDCNQGELAVRVCLNDLASAGVKASSMLMTILAPVDATDAQINEVFKQAGEAARLAGVEIIGGHTERTSAVNRLIVSATAFGFTSKKMLKTSSGALPGDFLYMTKLAAIEGSMIIASELKDIDQEIKFSELLSAEKDGILASKLDATALHDVTEGGVLGAIYELCDASGVGCKIDISNIPVDEYTIKVCNQKNIDPLRLIGSGSMLISVEPSKSKDLENEFRKSGVKLSKIGVCTQNKEKIKIIDGEESKILPPSEDHLFNN